jgi:hypothetical protein
MFLVFAYPQYYPSGGIDDCLGQFESLDAATDYVNKMVVDPNKERFEHAAIYDITQDLVVARYTVDDPYNPSKWVKEDDDYYEQYGYNALKMKQ